MKEQLPPFFANSKYAKPLALLAGLVFAYAVFEAGLRLWGAAYRAGQEARNEASAASGKYRIMCLGESTTAGFSWPALLEEELAARYPGAGFSVINKARGGSNTTVLLAELDRNLDEVRPFLVIAMMGINDGFVKYYEGIEDSGGPLFRRSRLYRLAKLLLKENGAPRAKLPAIGWRRRDPYTPYRDGTRSPEKEEEELFRRVRKNPDDAEAAYILGRFLSQGGGGGRRGRDKAAGEKLLLRALELDPGNSFACAALAEYYSRLPDRAGAVSMMERAVRIDRSSENLSLLGKYYVEAGRPADAAAVLEESADMDISSGGCGDAVLQLSSLRVLSGKLAAAEGLLRRADRACPGDERIAGALSIVYGASGKAGRARREEERLAAARSLFTATTKANYAALRRELASRGIALAVMQYPMCDPEPLNWLLEEKGDAVFISNYATFREAVARDGYGRYFVDMFAGNFGHCTRAGNALIAKNAADALAPLLERKAAPGPQER